MDVCGFYHIYIYIYIEYLPYVVGSVDSIPAVEQPAYNFHLEGPQRIFF